MNPTRYIVFLMVGWLATGQGWAQKTPQIPCDPEIRIGQLSNGLTYYIRHNNEPKNQTNFHLVQKAGSILEEDNEQGLAHLIEHLFFCGSEHFPGNSMIHYCQSKGVNFGADLNAYTSFDETVCNIDHIPTTMPGTVDSCLWILYDWINGLTLADSEIEKERLVIQEEWRTHSTANYRMLQQLLPQIYPNNRYGHRMPIGQPEMLTRIPYSDLRAFHHKWYRPDLQCIIVVGDINTDIIEQKIQEIFGPVPAASQPTALPSFPIDNNEQPIIALATDKEQEIAQTFLFFKHEGVPDASKKELNYLIYQYALRMATEMLNARFADLTEDPDAPFAQIHTEEGNYLFASSKQSMTTAVVCDPTRLQDILCMTYREILRARRHGFGEGEYERARNAYLGELEHNHITQEKKNSREICREMAAHFMHQEPLMNIEQEYSIMNRVLPQVPVEYINQVFQSIVTEENNLVVMSMLPEAGETPYPTEEQLRKALHETAQEETTPYTDNTIDRPLITKLPNPGKIHSREAAPFGYRRLVLSNGVNVFVKPTECNRDEILLTAYSEGGQSMYTAKDRIDLSVCEEVAEASGLGTFSASELKKKLAGQRVKVEPYMTIYSEGIHGSSSVRELETMFQLIYLHFTAPRTDTTAFKTWREQAYAIRQNAGNNPMSVFQDSVKQIVFQHHPLAAPMTAEDILQVNYNHCLQIHHERFRNAKDFYFVITGAVESASLNPLIERYLASLPALGKRETANKTGLDCITGEHNRIYEQEVETPQTYSVFIYSGQETYQARRIILYKMLEKILTHRLQEEIREKEGGTYSIAVNCVLNYQPSTYALLQVYYQTDPARYKYLNERIDKVIRGLAKSGPNAGEVIQTQEIMLLERRQQMGENLYWQEQLQTYINSGADLVSDYEQTIRSVTPDELRTTLAALLAQHNRILVTMKGKEKSKK